jgi:hypothetical protein
LADVSFLGQQRVGNKEPGGQNGAGGWLIRRFSGRQSAGNDLKITLFPRPDRPAKTAIRPFILSIFANSL